ncbi:hypothetical protein PAMP_018132 [Pampus punctatissimus]
MDHMCLVFMLLWIPGSFSGFQEEEHDNFKEIDDVRLIGGSSPCSGMLQTKQQGVWKEVEDRNWNLKLADVVCRWLDCGSVVGASSKVLLPESSWSIIPSSLNSESELRKGLTKRATLLPTFLKINCSDSIRMVNRSSLCSGHLQLKSNQSWFSVFEDDFDLQDAEVVCRELGCGAPSFLQGFLDEEVKAPMWTKCKGNESTLMDCGNPGSARNTFSSQKAVRLTCSEPDNVRLVEGPSRCAGKLEVKQNGEWNKVHDKISEWNLKAADVICRHLDCGSAVWTGQRQNNFYSISWWINSTCLQSESAVRECVFTSHYTSLSMLKINCSDSVRLVNETRLCSGRLEVKSNQSWFSVCEDDFDQQEAEVVCRELGCGAPSVFKGGLYGEVETPRWMRRLQCEGNESALLDCRHSGSNRNTCSSGRAVGLICSERDKVRLLGGATRCSGALWMQQQREWRPVVPVFDPVIVSNWDQKLSHVVCRLLDCGSGVTSKEIASSYKPVWRIRTPCVHSTLQECLTTITHDTDRSIVEVICSDFLLQPNISFFTNIDGVFEANQQGLHVLIGSSFNICCSIEPQYKGGLFQLIFNPSVTEKYTLPAVNHSACFLFSGVDHTYQGQYTCVYHINVFSQNFSSRSEPLYLHVSASLTELIIRLVVLLLIAMFCTALFYCKVLHTYTHHWKDCRDVTVTRLQTPSQEEKIELDELGGSGVEGSLDP